MCHQVPPVFFLLLTLLTQSKAARGDVTTNSADAMKVRSKDSTDNVILASPTTRVERLEVDLRKLKRTVNRWKSGGQGQKALCQQASEEMSSKITLELSGLRSQLHTSDTVTSLRSELQYGLASLRSELENKVTSLRAEMETGLTSVRSQLQESMEDIKTAMMSDVAEVKSEMQYSQNSKCGEEKETAAALASLQSGIQALKADLEGKLTATRTELEQRLLTFRAQLEGGVSEVKANFKTEVVTVRSDLQDMVVGVRKEMQDSMASSRTELQTGFTAAQLGQQNTMQSLQADLLNLSSKTQAELASLKSQVTSLSAIVRAEIQTDLTLTKTQLQGQLLAATANVEHRLDTVVSRLQQADSEHSVIGTNISHIQQRLAEVKVSTDKDLATLRKDLDAEVKNLKGHLEDSAASLASSVSQKDQGLQSLAATLNDLGLKVSDLERDLDTSKVELKRLMADGEAKLAAEASQQGSRLLTVAANLTLSQVALEDRLQELRNTSVSSLGSSYVRWGRQDCAASAQLVYAGVVGGSSYDAEGAAANRLCLTLQPEGGNVTGARTYIYGAEYKFSQHHDLDVVCAVCLTRFATTLMVPGTATCPPGWALQYRGHLTAGMVGHRAASEYLCLDSEPEHRPGSQEIRNGALFYYVFTQCGSLPCPPYHNMYVSCVVCSR